MKIIFIKDCSNGLYEPLHEYNVSKGIYRNISRKSFEAGNSIDIPNPFLKECCANYKFKYIMESNSTELITRDIREKYPSIYNYSLYHITTTYRKMIKTNKTLALELGEYSLSKFNILYLSALNKFINETFIEYLETLNAEDNDSIEPHIKSIEYIFKKTFKELKKSDLISSNQELFKYMLKFSMIAFKNDFEFNVNEAMKGFENHLALILFGDILVFKARNSLECIENRSLRKEYSKENSNNICPFLGIKADTIDHKTPLMLGGEDSPENYIMLSSIENSLKSNLTFETYLDISERYFSEVNRKYYESTILKENILKYKKYILRTLTKQKLLGKGELLTLEEFIEKEKAK